MTAVDIVTRLRQTRANMLGTDDEEHYWDCHDAANEIERLLLTAAERDAIEWSINDQIEGGHQDHPDVKEVITALRGLLERTK